MSTNTPRTRAATTGSREQARKREEEGRLKPGSRRRLPAQSQDADLPPQHEPGSHDGEKVSEQGDATGAPHPAAKGRDAPVDVR
ncbi:hypothetical protein [uncultured Pseudacidovorax sp.]|uniref:hypothetical protein n=1 Tax=uncultured Pseudacidovorax sp. TaxID=679313 RepID=UPI0025E85630|nr:hypothetical protein [uncultured Pseudacidovorax sp.]